MFRTTRTIDRTGFESVANDDPTKLSASRTKVHGVRIGRTAFVSTALRPCIYGMRTTRMALTPGYFVATERSLFVDSMTFRVESVDSGTLGRRISRCELLAHSHSRRQRQLALHTFVGHCPHGHQ